MLIQINGVCRLVEEPTLTYTNSGKGLCNIKLANSEKHGDKEEKCFIKAVLFGRTAEIVNQYCKKGSQIYVTGKLKQNSWDGKNGKKQYEHSIVIENVQLLDKKESGEPTTGRSTSYKPPVEVTYEDEELQF